MDELYERIEMPSDEPVAFVGVHPVRWQHEWGMPKAGFRPVDNSQVQRTSSDELDAEYADLMDAGWSEEDVMAYIDAQCLGFEEWRELHGREA